jgi:hydroxyacylglutathione hydrolase
MGWDIVTLPSGDNYIFCCIAGNEAAVIDATAAEPVIALLTERKLSLRLILSTHHHGDHTAGNALLRKQTGCIIGGGDRRIGGINRIVSDAERFTDGPFTFECIAVPGHTHGSFAFHAPAEGALFTGDTLFYAGCGRLFEGNAAQLHDSMEKLRQLPDSTAVYCGHEYTLDNLLFARSVEPDNQAIVERAVSVGLQLQKDGYYGPSTIGLEAATNPFLRTASATIRGKLGLTDAADDTVFGELRRRKDLF